MNKYLKRAIQNFNEKKFDTALMNFSFALKEKYSDDAKIGAMLSDLGTNKPNEALALFEYYMIAKHAEIKNSQQLIEEIIDALEYSVEEISNLYLKNEIEMKLDEENVIAYDDFRKIVADKNSFKEAFEDIMFSTKVIIQNKNDFIDFLEQLIDNGYKDISMNYFESAITMFPNDQRLLSLVEKVKQ
ncbi:MAG: tetratricopeptide repeat protein [Sulfurospirillum sp.]|nr:tetratricopeptide repeat protein [Sulfurospirillum sp.]